MGRGVRDDPLTDEEVASWWIRVRQKHAEANAAWQAEVERKLKENARTENAGAYNRDAEGKTGHDKEKKSSKVENAYKPVKISKDKKPKRKKTNGPRLL